MYCFSRALDVNKLCFNRPVISDLVATYAQKCRTVENYGTKHQQKQINVSIKICSQNRTTYDEQKQTETFHISELTATDRGLWYITYIASYIGLRQ
jgi:hypothetical protein